MSIRTNLIAAKALIEPIDKWVQGAFAKNKHGDRVPAKDGGAVCYCSLGALGKVLDINVGSGGWASIPNTYTSLLDDAAVSVVREMSNSREYTEFEEDDIEYMQIVDLNDLGDEVLPKSEIHKKVMRAFDIAIEKAPN